MTAKRLLMYNIDRRLRQDGITDSAFAAALGHTRQWMSKLRLDRQRGTTLAELDAIAAYFRVPVSELFRPPQ